LFVSTFVAPHSAILKTPVMSLGSSLPVGVNTSPSSLPSGSTLEQPFFVGPGFSPILAKTVNQIFAGKPLN